MMGVGAGSLVDNDSALSGQLMGGAGGELVIDIPVAGTLTGSAVELSGEGPDARDPTGASGVWSMVLTGEYDPDYEGPDEYPLMGTFTCTVSLGSDSVDCLEGRAGTFGFIRKEEVPGG